MENFYNFSLSIEHYIILDALEFTFTAYNQRKREGGKIKMHAIYSKFYFVLN